MTHCRMCQGPAVTHGSWQDSGVPLTFAAPTGPATLPWLSQHPTAAQHQLQLLCSGQQLGTVTCCPTPPAVALARSCQGDRQRVCSRSLSTRSRRGGGRKAARAWTGSTACPQGHWQAADIGHGIAQEGEVPQDHAASRGTSLLLPPHGSLPGALGREAMRFQFEFISQPQGSRAKVLLGSLWG